MRRAVGRGWKARRMVRPEIILRACLLLVLFLPPALSAASNGSRTLPPGDWRALEGGRSVIYYEPQDQKAAEGLADLYRRSLPEMAAKLGVSVPSGVRVFIAPNKGRFHYLTRGLPEWTGGVVYPAQRVVVLQAPRMYGEKGRFAVTALHEGVHLLTELDGASHLPRWLSEGLAMYLSGETMYKHRGPLGRAVVLGKTYTLAEIDDVLQLGPEQARVAYLQSINAVQFIVEQWGWPAIARLVRGYRAGEDPDAMFREITGRDFFSVEAAWHQSLRKEYKWWKFVRWLDFDTLLWTSAALLVVFSGGVTLYKRRRYLRSRPEEETSQPDWHTDIYTGDWDEEDDTWR